jgi:UDP-N-acetyl-2-amino-2-deoxyglucuronate dehydrogenase
MVQNFAITGVGGFIAPRHLQAIYDTGNRVVCALDIHDSVGILDRYAPDIDFFTEFERFDRHVEKLRRNPEFGRKVDYVSICSPNYLHDAHIRFALRVGAHAICEKPVVLNPWNIEALQELESEAGKRVFCVLQLRNHPVIRALKQRHEGKSKRKHEIALAYITPRGKWYQSSWKGQEEKSGGVSTNIGIHFFDMLIWIFGAVLDSRMHHRSSTKAGGFLELERARVRWFMSIDRADLPPAQDAGKPAHRSITIDGVELEFSDGFTDLHTQIYRQIVDGQGFRMADAKPSIELVHAIRSANPSGLDEDMHPMTKRVVEQALAVARTSAGRGAAPAADRGRDSSLVR